MQESAPRQPHPKIPNTSSPDIRGRTGKGLAFSLALALTLPSNIQRRHVCRVIRPTLIFIAMFHRDCYRELSSGSSGAFLHLYKVHGVCWGVLSWERMLAVRWDRMGRVGLRWAGTGRGKLINTETKAKLTNGRPLNRSSGHCLCFRRCIVSPFMLSLSVFTAPLAGVHSPRVCNQSLGKLSHVHESQLCPEERGVRS